jgi:hypothetical protein
MKRIFTILTVLLIQMSFTTASEAKGNRQQQQGARIDQGVESGQITDQEAQKLDRSQEGISAMHEKATSDGSVSSDEARGMNKATHKAGKATAKASRNSRSAE